MFAANSLALWGREESLTQVRSFSRNMWRITGMLEKLRWCGGADIGGTIACPNGSGVLGTEVHCVAACSPLSEGVNGMSALDQLATWAMTLTSREEMD
jgi:hypothetical protein